mmetsp:Transcript_31532/g.52676  ORF Transcript_31532/g.52676 Transcript_31532/m.52676 type:complete len:85 (-) Transcript_31532:1077-1331(-)
MARLSISICTLASGTTDRYVLVDNQVVISLTIYVELVDGLLKEARVVYSTTVAAASAEVAVAADAVLEAPSSPSSPSAPVLTTT